jgi:cytochrome c oxidase cbb3-type subunit 3
MSKETDKKIEGHAYNGIEEFDNPLPGWWINGFYLTIVFAAVYIGWYHLGNGQSIEQEFQADRAAVQAKIAASAKKLELPSAEKLVEFSKDSAKLGVGKAQFTKNVPLAMLPMAAVGLVLI